MTTRSVLAMVLAGGEGKRLAPLTADRAKPAVPFGGSYRIIDFALSNLANAGYMRIVVLTQYKSHSLDRHVTQTWRLDAMLGDYVTPVPAQMRRGRHWFAGSADAIFQNLNLVYDERPAHVVVFGADHIYRMDPRQMVAQHVESGAGVTVAAIRVPLDEAREFGVVERGPGSRIAAFIEKPSQPPPVDGDPGRALVSMGNYVFSTEALVEAVSRDADDPRSRRDIGGSIIPAMVAAGEAHVYDFAANSVPGSTDRDRGYWRDVGSLDAYYEASMDLVSVSPVFNLYNYAWPIYTWSPPRPPAKFVFDEAGRRGQALDSMVGPGAIVAGGTVRRSVLSPDVHIHAGASVEGSVVMHGADVGRGAVVRNAILDKEVRVEPGARIGVDLDADRARFVVSPRGVVVVGKRQVVTAGSGA